MSHVGFELATSRMAQLRYVQNVVGTYFKTIGQFKT